MAFWIKSCVILLITVFAGGKPLLAQNTDMEVIFDKHQAVMLLIDPGNGQIIRSNAAAAEFYGYGRAQLEEMSIQQINALSPQAVAAERELAARENRNYFIFRHRLASGEIRTVEVSSVPVSYQGDSLLFSIIRDISELRQAEDALWHYQNRLEKMVEAQLVELKEQEDSRRRLLLLVILVLVFSTAGLVIMLHRSRSMGKALALEKERLDEVIWSTSSGTWEQDIRSGQILINARWAEIMGYDPGDLGPVTHAWRKEMIHPEDIALADKSLRQHFDGVKEGYEAEIRVRHKDGHWVWVMEKGKVVERDADGHPLRIVGTHQDISLQKQASEQLRHLAHHDTLTDLPNRSLFFDRLQQAIRIARRNHERLAVLFIDLDGFKKVNDNYGHRIGDLLLKEMADRLKRLVRQSDTAGRLGGDEFAIVLHQINTPEDACRLAEKLIRSLGLPVLMEENLSLSVSCSVGISVYPDHCDKADALVQEADLAMYRAKKSGKGHFRLADSPGADILNETY